MSLARLFFGLEVSDEARDELFAARGRFPDARGMCARELYHITLCFLGDTDRRRVPELGALADGLSAAPFELELAGMGTFRGGDILWAGLKPSVELTRLQRGLAEALAGACFPVERGAYTPHITVARGRRALPAQLPRLRPVRFAVDGVTLFESARVGGELKYLPIYRSPLRGER